MTTTAAGWPSQLMLPGQAAAPDGPVDMANMYLFHHAFRRDLTRFAGSVARTPVDDVAAWKRLFDRWGVFSRQLHHHHEAEDRVLWPWLRDRATGEELAMLDAMEREHGAIDPGLDAVTAGFAAMSSEGGDRSDNRAALVVRVAGVREVLDQHLAHEETDAIALLQRVTTPAEWAALEKQFSTGQPISALLEMLPWFADDLDPRVLRRVLSGAPLPLRVLYRVLRPGFDRRERAAFPAA